MRTRTPTAPWPYLAGLVLLCLAGGPAAGQTSDGTPLPRLLDLGSWPLTDGDRPAAPRNRALRFFRMPTGFVSDPVGADVEAEPTPAGETPALAPDDGDLPVGAALYDDNPYFDFRRPGDVGGPGYYRIHTQVQLVGTETTGCTLGLQAVTPAGLENDGLAEGPTAFYPNLALFQELFGGLALQGYIGKSLRARPGWEDHLGHSLEYGLALAEPVAFGEGSTPPQVHVFVEALGRYRVEGDASGGGAGVLELLPGVHWRMSDSCWLTGGLIMPLNTPHRDLNLWQVTCSWHF